jgi:hypothetical protein
MKKKTQTPAEVEATKQKASDAVDSLTRTPAADATKPPAAPQPPTIQDPPKPPAVPSGPRDGFSDISDNDSYIKGTKVRFTNDWQWVTDRDEVLAADREFLVIGLKRTVQKWVPGAAKPEVVELGETERWPDLDQWNEDAPASEWSVKFGKDTGPWQRCCFAYLLDPKTFEGFTFLTPSWGGKKAVDELRESTRRRRLVTGQSNSFPVVTLSDVFAPNDYGGRQRPFFVLKDWKTLGGPAAPSAPALAKPADNPPDKPANAADKKPADKNADLNDEIPY